MKDQFIIPGMPLEYFPEPPSDQPGCELVTCKHCEEKMWLSKKKRALALSVPNALIACWTCLMKMKLDGFFQGCKPEMFQI